MAYLIAATLLQLGTWQNPSAVVAKFFQIEFSVLHKFSPAELGEAAGMSRLLWPGIYYLHVTLLQNEPSLNVLQWVCLDEIETFVASAVANLTKPPKVQCGSDKVAF